ncbi:type VI secretion system tube protein Hcp [Xenorhabdus sp. Reich]|uniref:Type VI secretion system tube protein Hcp n=1 Tax=Xenorhabdus littoralis TaxID=2582835 RepID=A0ABU4SPJ5_9GAMM|nr:type VI secretion system tube protein Hcp [Xenorhabdus sp. Reich]MDX8000581.1 type VI secretion system tube protein Hcp [Xenorhabdus sp. Reich]
MAEINYGFMKLEGIDGETGESNHKNWVSFNNIGIQTINKPSADGVSGLSAGVPVIDEVRLFCELEKAYITMRKFLYKGQHIATIKIELLKRGEAKNIVWQSFVLTNALIVYSSINISAGFCMFEIGLDYEQYEETYTGQKETGISDASIHHGYNRFTNEVI